jgi:prephenate dehydrogenase
MPRAAVIGVGLMGGSLGMALRARGWRVTGVGRDLNKLRRAKARGAVDEVTTDLAAASAAADAVVLAVPVAEIVPLGRRIWSCVRAGAVVTDVGSVKGPIVRAFAGWPAFVGAHPMCGSEKAGIEHARADLYRGAPCLLTPAGRARGAWKKAAALWKAAGTRVVTLSAEEHDRRVALVSHLPHLMAEALVLALGGAKGRAWVPSSAAGSFRDATRVAGADPALWASIFAMNRPAVRSAAKLFLSAFRRLLSQGPSERDLAAVRRLHADFNRGASQ